MKQILVQNINAIIYRFSNGDDYYYYIVTRLNFNKKGKRKSMYFNNYKDAENRFLEINYK